MNKFQTFKIQIILYVERYMVEDIDDHDGKLIWYNLRYLKMVRTDYPNLNVLEFQGRNGDLI